MSEGPVTQRDIYELARRVEEKIDRARDEIDEVREVTSARFQKVYWGFVVILITIGTPKVGGPSLPGVVAEVQKWLT